METVRFSDIPCHNPEKSNPARVTYIFSATSKKILPERITNPMLAQITTQRCNVRGWGVCVTE